MEEAKYFKDYQHNYLILKCEGTGVGESYQSRMLLSGKIERLLKCSVRHINGEAFLYCDISSRVTLENLYRGKKLSYEQARELFRQLDGIYRILEEYFMEEAGLLVFPESIYYDLSSERYFGLYYPGKKGLSDKPYEKLMDFLLNHTDTGVRKMTDILYRIYEMSGEPFFSIGDALSLFEEEEETPAEVNGIEECMQTQTAQGYIMDKKEGKMTEMTAADDCGYFDIVQEAGKESEEAEPHVSQQKNRAFYGVFAIFSLGGIAAAVWLCLHFVLTEQEMLLLICCAGVMGLCFIFSVVQLLLSGSGIRKKEQEESALLWDIEDEFRDERPIAIQNVLDKNMDMRTERICLNSGQAAGREEEKAPCGETVFLDIRRQKAEYKLYSLDKKNKKHIDLTRFPFSIGKMPGCVDCVLPDDSVSRLHARLEKQGERILLTDMNSTNGTYKNGLRMEPSETVEIEPGDEIRFGKLNYCYR